MQMQLDEIISKYRKKPQPISTDEHQPEKRSQPQDPLPSTDTHQFTTNIRQKDQNKLLKQLNYNQLSLKYDKLKQVYDTLQIQLEKQKKIRIQESIDSQNKLHLLQLDHQKNLVKMESKNSTIAVLEQKLCQKEEEALIFEQEMELISKKLSEVMHTKQQQSFKLPQQQPIPSIPSTNDQSPQSIHNLKQHYQNYISLLTTQLAKQTTTLFEKQKQNRKILQQMQTQSYKNQIQLKQLKQLITRNQIQYTNWLNQVKQDKLKTIDKYQQILKQTRKKQCQNNPEQMEDIRKNKQLIHQLSATNEQLVTQITTIKLQKNSIITIINALTAQLKQIKTHHTNQVTQNKKIITNLQNEQIKCNQTKIQLQEIKKKYEEVLTANKRLQKQLQNTDIKKQLNQSPERQNNTNSILTQTTLKMKTKIQNLEHLLHSITAQLYAQRLLKAKMLSEAQTTKNQHKKQYELSSQTKKQEFEDQIKENLRGMGSTIDVEKQKMYLQMLKLEREYQLLKSETVTSEEMLKMGTKISKYYQKRAK